VDQEFSLTVLRPMREAMGKKEQEIWRKHYFFSTTKPSRTWGFSCRSLSL